MRRLLLLLPLLSSFVPCVLAQTIRVEIPATARPLASGGSLANAPGPIDGRLLLLLSNDATDEPRMQINDTPSSQMIFGMTLNGARPGTSVVVDDSAAGYPYKHLSDVPAGTYKVQAVLNFYETFHRGDGAVIKLAPDRGEGQHWNLAPGNLYSTPFKITLSTGGKPTKPIEVKLDKVIPPLKPAADTGYVRRMRMQSPLLTKFWGRPVYPLRNSARSARLR